MIQMLSFIIVIFMTLFFYHIISQILKLSYLDNQKSFSLYIASIICAPLLKINSPYFIFVIHFFFLSLLFTLIYKILSSFYQNKTLTYIFKLQLFPLLISSLLITYGYFNMKNIVKVEYDIQTTKDISKNYKLVMISDLHYPTSLHQKEVIDLIKKINKEKADAAILCGDIIDEYTSENEMKEVFSKLGEIKCPIIYVYGNHDLGRYGDDKNFTQDSLIKVINKNKITLLKDHFIKIGELSIIGRDDYKLKRKSLQELLSQIPDQTFSIVLDHRPLQLMNHSQLGTDLVLSGHTHDGQIFPLHMIYELFHINELNYGIKDFNGTKAITSSGVSGWGFPIITENHSEYGVINIEKDN